MQIFRHDPPFDVVQQSLRRTARGNVLDEGRSPTQGSWHWAQADRNLRAVGVSRLHQGYVVAHPGCALLAVLVLSSCAPAVVPSFYAQHSVDHPLVGKIYRPSSQTFVSASAVAADVSAARFVLLGEQHDNPDHHHLQARLLQVMITRGRHPALALEMLDLDDSEAIRACRERRRCTVARFARDVGWKESGWPDWQIYAPLLSVALDNDLPIAPADLPRAEVREYLRTGTWPDDPALPYRLGTRAALDPVVRLAMVEELRRAHCGFVAEPAIRGMLAAQRLRDAHMAESLVLAAGLERVVLVAGAAHVREDRGVVRRLHEIEPGSRVVSVAFLEVAPGRTHPAAYAADLGVRQLPFDYVWFTARADDEDPCEVHRKRLQSIGR